MYGIAPYVRYDMNRIAFDEDFMMSLDIKQRPRALSQLDFTILFVSRIILEYVCTYYVNVYILTWIRIM